MKKKTGIVVNRVTALAMTAMLVIAGIVISPIKSNAANTSGYTDEIVYEAVSGFDFDERASLVPEKEGYIFGGWFTDEAGTSVIETADDVTGATVYAKMVPSYVLSVKAQNGTYEKDATKTTTTTKLSKTSPYTDFRMVTSVDSTKYKEVGYTVYLGNNENNALYMDKAEKTPLTTTKVYTEIKAGDNTYKPDAAFGDCSEYFVVWTLNNIPTSQFGTIIYVKPFWTTMDGTKAEGLGKYVHVNDGLDEVINVPVNIKTATAIAAGALNVDYDESKLTYIGFEASNRLLTEMSVADEDGVVKCAGNVSDISSNIAADKDLYVNLRFTLKSGTFGAGSGFLEFTVNDESFCDKDEEFVTDIDKYIWDVRF